MNESNTPELPEDQLPQEVVAALRERHGSRIKVPEKLSAAILADAGQHLGNISRPIPVKSGSRKWAWVALSTGTLAAAMLLFAVMPPTEDGTTDRTSFASQETETSNAFADAESQGTDIDGNGQTNILDAFALARTIKSGDSHMSRWDQNGDGRTDQNDVNLVALHAVTL